MKKLQLMLYLIWKNRDANRMTTPFCWTKITLQVLHCCCGNCFKEIILWQCGMGWQFIWTETEWNRYRGFILTSMGLMSSWLKTFTMLRHWYFEIGLIKCLLWKYIFVDFFQKNSYWVWTMCADDLGGLNMGSVNFIWNLTKNYFTFGLIGLTVSDRYASIVPVGGISMSPTFNPHDSSMRSLTRNDSFSSPLSS